MHALTNWSYNTDVEARDLDCHKLRSSFSLPFVFVEHESHLVLHFYKCLENRCEERKHTMYLVSWRKHKY